MTRPPRPDGTDPPPPAARNRRVHRVGDAVRRRSTLNITSTLIPIEVPDGQAAPTTEQDSTPAVVGTPESAVSTPTVITPGVTPGVLAADGGPHTGAQPAVPAGYDTPLTDAQGIDAPPPGDTGARAHHHVAESDWMAAARQQAELASHRDSVSSTWVPGAGLEEDLEIDLTGSASLVRPYARTGGRTRPVRDLDLEALVRTTLAGKEASTSPWLTPEHTSIIEMCSGTVSVAEIAARLAVPLGVARVIIADMMDLGLVEVMKTSATDGDERDPDFLRRVLSGLQRL